MTSSKHRSPRRTTLRLIGLLLPALLLGAAPAGAAGTSPVLTLTAADAFSSTAGGRLVTADGAFNFDDLVQIPFPAAGLMVVQGAHLARYDVDGGVGEGTSALAADGITPAELATVLAASAPTDPPARLVSVEPHRVAVVLPATFVAGPATVLLFAIHENESFVSNAIAVVLP
jgi:hypothetical protein